MKKLVWEVKAFVIWGVNSIAEIKLGGFKPYMYAMLLFILVVCMSSCSSTPHYRRPCKPLNKALVYNDTIPDYFYINNTIVMVK